MIDFHWLISPISVRNSHQNSKHRRKTNVDSRFLMNKIIRSIFTLQVANIGIDIILASFKFLNNCDFLKFFESIRDLDAARMKRDPFSGKSLSFVAFY